MIGLFGVSSLWGLQPPDQGGDPTAANSITITSGSATWTVPDGATTLTIECWGGGGSGSAAITGFNPGGGGGGGGYSIYPDIPVTGGSDSVFYAVGAAGSASDGGDTSAFIYTGGIAIYGYGGKQGAGGMGGSASGGITNTSGSTGVFGGANGGDGGNAGDGTPGGAGGIGSDGSPGTSPGGGGGGGDLPNYNGADGGAGQIRFTWS